MKFTRDKRFWDEQEWGNRKPEWHWHAYRRHMVRRREQACDLASSARWRRVKKPLLDRLFRKAVAALDAIRTPLPDRLREHLYESLRLRLREHAGTARLARRLLEPVAVPPDLIQAGLRPAVRGDQI